MNSELEIYSGNIRIDNLSLYDLTVDFNLTKKQRDVLIELGQSIFDIVPEEPYRE